MRNLQSDIIVSLWNTKNINTTLEKDMQALYCKVFDVWIQAAPEMKQKCLSFSRCKSTRLYWLRRTSGILIEGR